ncbi:MAG: helix-turn-helix domain-containing protein [Bacillota bacterium]
MKMIEYVDLTHKPFILNFKHSSSGKEWEKFHAHQGMEMLFVHEGTGQVVIDQKIHPVSSNMLILFQPYQLHRIKIDSVSSMYVRTVLNFDPYFLEPYLKPFPEFKSFFNFIWKENLPQQIYQLENNNEEITMIYERFHERLAHTSSERQKEEFVLFMISLLQSVRSITNMPFTRDTNSMNRPIHNSEKIMQWVEEHYKEEFSLTRLANDLHLSPYHVSHLFKNETGSTIMHYIIARRLREACQLLSTTDLPINYICEEIGINNTSYFSQLFKKNIGLSPKDFRGKLTKTFR